MFITVKYGQNESLLCNPGCAVVNLLTNIKRRAGYGHTNKVLDLSDETGLIKELDGHKHEYATSLLSSHATYILLQKDRIRLDGDNSEVSTKDKNTNFTTQATPQFTYTALLEHIHDLFPNFQLRMAEVEDSKAKGKKLGTKSPSPAGRLLSKPKKQRSSSSMSKRK